MPTQFYNSLVKAIGIQQEVQELRKRFTSSNHHVRLANVVPSYDALVLAEIFELAAREVVFVMETATEAERLYDDLVKLLSEESVILFAEAEQHSRMAKALK